MSVDGPRLFQGEITGSESGQYSFDLSGIHWSLWGQQINYDIVEKGTDPQRLADFEIYLRLSGSPSGQVARGTMELSAEIISSTGDSYYDPTKSTVKLALQDSVGQVVFEPVANQAKRLAGFTSSSFNTTFVEAVAAARKMTNLISVLLSAPTAIPCFIDVVHVRSIDGRQRYYRATAPYPIQAPASLPSTIQSLRPFITMYAEGLRATSVFYRFLCFFKIVEQLIDVVAPKLTKIGKKCAIERLKFNSVVPNEPFDKIAPEFSGKKITAIRVEMQKRYRNVIAHFDLRSTIQPFDLGAEAQVGSSAAVLAFAARELLDTVHVYLDQLNTAGYDCKRLRLDSRGHNAIGIDDACDPGPIRAPFFVCNAAARSPMPGSRTPMP